MADNSRQACNWIAPIEHREGAEPIFALQTPAGADATLELMRIMHDRRRAPIPRAIGALAQPASEAALPHPPIDWTKPIMFADGTPAELATPYDPSNKWLVIGRSGKRGCWFYRQDGTPDGGSSKLKLVVVNVPEPPPDMPLPAPTAPVQPDHLVAWSAAPADACGDLFARRKDRTAMAW